MHFSIVMDVCLFDVTLLSNIILSHGWYCHWYRCLEHQPVALEVRHWGETIVAARAVGFCGYAYSVHVGGNGVRCPHRNRDRWARFSLARYCSRCVLVGKLAVLSMVFAWKVSRNRLMLTFWPYIATTSSKMMLTYCRQKLNKKCIDQGSFTKFKWMTLTTARFFAAVTPRPFRHVYADWAWGWVLGEGDVQSVWMKPLLRCVKLFL